MPRRGHKQAHASQVYNLKASLAIFPVFRELFHPLVMDVASPARINSPNISIKQSKTWISHAILQRLLFFQHNYNK